MTSRWRCSPTSSRRAAERLPEVAQHVLPEPAAAGHVVEPVLELGGEAVLDPVAELLDQEGVDQPALVLGHEALLLQPDVGPVLQDRDDAGVGAGPADAQLLQPLDQARLAVARRRLGEVLERRHLPLRKRVADLASGGRMAPSSSSSPRGVVAPLLVELEEAVEGHGLAGGAQAHAPSAEPMSTVTRSSRAAAIWLATVRFQISS